MWFDKNEALRILERTKTGVQHGPWLRLKMAVPIFLSNIYNTIKELQHIGGIAGLLDMNQKIGDFPEESSWRLVAFGNGTLSAVAHKMLGRVTILSIGHSYGYFYLTHFIFFTFALAMRDVAKEFAIKMMETKEDVEQGTKEFLNLKNRIHELNDIFGTRLLIYFFASTAYFVTGPDLVRNYQTTSNFEIYGYFLFFATSILFWTIGAYFHALVQGTLRSWLDYQIFQNCQNCRSFEIRVQLDSIEREYTAGCPCLAISTKYFAVTNGFLGTVNNLL